MNLATTLQILCDHVSVQKWVRDWPLGLSAKPRPESYLASSTKGRIVRHNFLLFHLRDQ